MSVYDQELMFEEWVKNPNFRYVARVCKVDFETVRRYHKRNRWDERIELIRLGIAQQTDEKLAQVIAKMIQEIGELRAQAYLASLGGAYDNARQASQTYRELADLEVRLRQPLKGVEGGLLALIRERYQDAQRVGTVPALDKSKEITQATIVPQSEDGQKDSQLESLQTDNGVSDEKTTPDG